MGKERDKDLDRWVRAETDDYLEEPAEKRITRRRALGMLGGAGVAGAGAFIAGREVLFDPVGNRKRRRRRRRRPTSTTQPPATQVPTTAPPPTDPPQAPALWSDPATWNGAVPGAGDIALVQRPVILDVDAQVAGVQIEPSGQLIYDPAASHTLTSTGNVVVHGLLRMRPNNASVNHVMAFAGVNEARFVGGHTDQPIDSDVGVWVLHGGVLDLLGTAKSAWTNLAGEAAAGAATITVNDASGWQVGDEIVVTPTQSPTSDHDHWQNHDRRVISAVAGNRVTLDRPLDHPHPTVTVRSGVTHSAEVLNLGRNVRIEGAPDARAHVMVLHAMRPQQIGYVGLRHMGPAGVLGRYGLHFHMSNDGVRGSSVEGVAAADCANHVYVVHLSNGVNLRDCVGHDSVDEMYWWDQAADDADDDSVPSHDVVYERCVASFVKFADNPHSNSGFMLGTGRGNVARDCVATGIQGRSHGSTGFRWSQGSRDFEHEWVFEDNLAHNNPWSAINYWQNNVGRTIVDRLTVYHCGSGIHAGAYNNLVSYRDCTIYGCETVGLRITATPADAESSGGQTITYEGMYVDQAGNSDYAVEITEHVTTNDRATLISGGTFKGANHAQVGFPTGGEIAQIYDFLDCTFEGNAFWVAQGVPANSQIRVIGGNVGGVTVHPPGGPGQRRAEWNASTTPA